MAKRNEIIKDILTILTAAGLITIALVAPGALIAIDEVLKLNKKYTSKQIKRSFRNLERTKIISLTEEDGKTVMRLTKKGQKKVMHFKLEDMKIKPMKRWDRKWRLVIFDVPKDFHVNRTIFAQKLKGIGFKKLQKSVWITPYPCEDEVDFLKEIYLIRPYVRVIIAEAIDIQNDLLMQFNLL